MTNIKLLLVADENQPNWLYHILYTIHNSLNLKLS